MAILSERKMSKKEIRKLFGGGVSGSVPFRPKFKPGSETASVSNAKEAKSEEEVPKKPKRGGIHALVERMSRIYEDTREYICRLFDRNGGNTRDIAFFQKTLGRGGYIFYKPDPENQDIADRWAVLPHEQQLKIATDLATEFVPQVMGTLDLQEGKDYDIGFARHFAGDEILPAIHIRFHKLLTFEEMKQALMDVAFVLRSVGGIQVFDPYN